MRKRTLAAVALSTFLVVVACQPPGQQAASAELSDADVAAIEALAASYRDALIAGDWEAISALYTEDAVQMPPNAPAIQGREAIHAHNQEEAVQVSAFENPPTEIVGRADLAYARGTYSITMNMGEMMEPMSEDGKYVVITRKQPDDSWLVAVEMWSSNQPPPGMEEMDGMEDMAAE